MSASDDIYDEIGDKPIKRKSGSSDFKREKSVQKKLEEVDAKTQDNDKKLESQWQLIAGILIAVAIALVVLVFDALKFHLDYSRNNKEILEQEFRLKELEFRQKILEKTHPELFDSIENLSI